MCTLEDGKGFSALVEWDPLVREPLLRRVRIPSKTTTSSVVVRCSAEPIHPTLKPELNLAWSFNSHVKLSESGVLITTQDLGPPSILKDPSISITLSKPDGDSEIKLLRESTVHRRDSARSLGIADEKDVQEIFQAIAEVVVEKARTRGMRVLEGRLRDDVCGQSAQPILPETCAAITRTRLEDLAASGRELAEALIDDLCKATFTGLPEPVQDKHLIRQLVQAAIDLTGGRHDLARDVALNVAIDLLQAMNKPAANTSKATPPEQAHTIAQVIFDCNANRSCNAAAIRVRLSAPEDYYGYGYSPVSWERAPAFVASALHVLRAPATTTEAEQVASTLGLVLDFRDLTSPTTPGSPTTLGSTEQIRHMVDGVLERNITKVIISSLDLVPKGTNTDQLLQASKALATLGSFLTVSTGGREPSADERTERREARKKALGSLIDQFGDRSNRRGDTVLSISSNLMFGPAGLAYLPSANAQDSKIVYQATPVSLTLGLALDTSDHKGLGFHIDLSVLDLGGYASIRSGGATATPCAKDANCKPDAVSIAPGDVIRPAITFGPSYLFRDANLIFFVGPSVGYAPKIGVSSDAVKSAQSAFYAALVAGVTIPIFDLN
jgi:hypothetical protein